MKKVLIGVFITLISCNNDPDNDAINNTIESLKRSQFYQAKNYAIQIQNRAIKELFLYQIKYCLLYTSPSPRDS